MSNDDRDRLLASARSMTDDELRVGMAEASKRRDELVAAAEHWLAEQLNELCCVMADVRSERLKLRLAIDEATNPVKVIAPARQLFTSSERRKHRRQRS